jgi:hypothetical protein
MHCGIGSSLRSSTVSTIEFSRSMGILLMLTVNTVELQNWVPPEGAGAMLSFDLEV